MKKKIYSALFVMMCLFFGQSVVATSLEIVTTDPAPVVAGDYADVTIRLTQPFLGEGGEKALTDVTLTLSDTAFIRAEQSESIKIGTLLRGDVFTKTLRLYVNDNTPQGTITLPFVLNTGESKTTHDLDLYVQEMTSLPELVIGQIEVVPDKLLIDSQNNVFTVTVQNLGEKDAELVRAKLTILDDEVSPSHTFSDQDSVASIEDGSEVEFEFTYDVDFPTETKLPAQLVLNYRALDASQSTYDTFMHKIDFDIPLSESPFLEIVSVEQKTSFEQGSAENVLRLVIKNTGEDEAKEVRIRVVPDISYPFIFETTTQYLASSIKPGEENAIEFTMEVLGDASIREYPMTLKLESLAGNTRFEQEDTATITPTPKPQVSNGFIANVVVVIVLLVSIIIGIKTIIDRRK